MTSDWSPSHDEIDAPSTETPADAALGEQPAPEDSELIDTELRDTPESEDTELRETAELSDTAELEDQLNAVETVMSQINKGELAAAERGLEQLDEDSQPSSP